MSCLRYWPRSTSLARYLVVSGSPKRRRLASQSAPETVLAPYVEAFLALPAHLPHVNGHPLSYAACIAMLAVTIRGVLSLPITLWARRRMDRLEDVCNPELGAYAARKSEEMRGRAKQSAAANADVSRTLRHLVARKRSQLLKHHRCGPFVTFSGQLLLQGSIFITTSMMLRYAVIWPDSATSMPSRPQISEEAWAETVPPELSDVSMDIMSYFSDLSYVSTAISREAWAWCPSLASADPYAALPIAIGFAAFCSIEVMHGARSAIQKARQETTSVPVPSQSAPTSEAQALIVRAGGLSAIISRIVAVVQRTVTVWFIYVALNSPAALCLYWMASFLMTLLQSLAFAALDHRKAAAIRAAFARASAGVSPQMHKIHR